MIRPKYLQKGDSVVILSTARHVLGLDLEHAESVLNDWGLNVIYAPNIQQVEMQFAGSDESRASDFQWAMDHPRAKAILCARGGYGTVRIIDSLDFSSFRKNPKWICGFSDVTVLHNHVNQLLEIETIHSTMPVSFKTNTLKSLTSLKNALFGEVLIYPLEPTHILSNPNDLDRVKGPMIGGNLSIIASLLGSESQLDTQGKILFLEDIDEMLYHVDRVFYSLKRAGLLEGLKALIIGGMTAMRDNTKEFGFEQNNPFGKNAREIIIDHASAYDFPVIWEFPSGHIQDNCAWYSGRDVDLQLKNPCQLTFT